MKYFDFINEMELYDIKNTDTQLNVISNENQNESIKITSYEQINELYNDNYTSTKFTDFELKLFNEEFDESEYNIDKLNADELYSLINYCKIFPNKTTDAKLFALIKNYQ